MPIRSAVALAATLLASTAALAAGGNFERSLHTSSTPTLAVFTPSGALRVHAGSGSEVHIKANVYSSNHGSFFGGRRSDADLQAHIQQIVNAPPIHQSGDRVEVGDRDHNDLYRDITIDYDVTVPAGSHLDLQTGSGDVEIGAAGDGIHARSGSGSIRAREVKGAIDFETGSGDVELEADGPGNVQARTGSGSIRLRHLQGAFDARTGSGDIEVSSHITGNSRATTGSGSVRLDLDHAGVNLHAHTGSGSIRANGLSSSNSDEERHHVSAPINGGGPILDITTGSGDIEIH